MTVGCTVSARCPLRYRAARMGRRRVTWVVCVALSALGCGGGDDAYTFSSCPLSSLEEVTRATPLGAARFDASGVTAAQTAFAGAGFVAVALDDASRCVTIETAHAGATSLVDAMDYGLTCSACAQRVTVMRGGGIFPLPSDGTALRATATFTLGLRDCVSYGASASSATALTATLWTVFARDEPLTRRAVVRVDLVSLPGSWLAGADDATADRFARAVSAELSDANLDVQVASRCALGGAVADVNLNDHDDGPIEVIRSRARGACTGYGSRVGDPRVTVIVAGCVRADGLAVPGYTTRVAAGFTPIGVPEGVVVGGACEGAPAVVDGIPEGLARATAHELGHYLGLYHSVDGAMGDDRLSDTDADNLMNADVTLAISRGLSATQARVMRRHPAIRWPRAAFTACAAR